MIACGILFLLKGVIGLVAEPAPMTKANSYQKRGKTLQELEDELSDDYSFEVEESVSVDDLPDYVLESLEISEAELAKRVEADKLKETTSSYISFSDLETLRRFVEDRDVNSDLSALNDLRTHLNLIMRDSSLDRQVIDQLIQLVDVQVDNAESRSELMILIYDAIPADGSYLKQNIADQLLSHYQLTENQMDYLETSRNELPTGQQRMPAATDYASTRKWVSAILLFQSF